MQNLLNMISSQKGIERVQWKQSYAIPKEASHVHVLRYLSDWLIPPVLRLPPSRGPALHPAAGRQAPGAQRWRNAHPHPGPPPRLRRLGGTPLAALVAPQRLSGLVPPFARPKRLQPPRPLPEWPVAGLARLPGPAGA